MEKDHYIGLLILLGIIFMAIYGGSKNAHSFGSFATSTPVVQTKQQQIDDTQNKIVDIQKQVQAIEDAKVQSKYKNLVYLQYINRASDPKNEYISMYVSSGATTTIPITGWQLKSLSSGNSVTIPSGTLLYFSGTTNSEDTIVLSPGDQIYISTGVSPNGYSFRINKCTGYLSQFQTFIPYIFTFCPQPRNENMSSIPKTVNNDSCFDYIDSYPSCKTQSTESTSLPLNLSPECVKFIYEKLNYTSCVNTHKDDTDFYTKEWRVFLKRSAPLWKTQREDVVLLDNEGKVVSEIKY